MSTPTRPPRRGGARLRGGENERPPPTRWPRTTPRRTRGGRARRWCSGPYGPGPLGQLSVLSIFHSKSVLYGVFVCAGRLTSQNGGFRPGQKEAGRGEPSGRQERVDGPGPPGAVKRPQQFFPIVNRVCVGPVYGRAGRLTYKNGGFRPGRADARRKQPRGTARASEGGLS